MPLCQIFLLAQSHLPANQHQFLDENKIFKKFCASWLVNGFVQAGIFGKVAFFIIFMIYFNILNSLGLVH